MDGGDTDWGMVKLGIAMVTKRMGKRDAGGRDSGGHVHWLQQALASGRNSEMASNIQNRVLGSQGGPVMETVRTGGVFGLGLGGITPKELKECRKHVHERSDCLLQHTYTQMHAVYIHTHITPTSNN